jgi:hypothetical protein
VCWNGLISGELFVNMLDMQTFLREEVHNHDMLGKCKL